MLGYCTICREPVENNKMYCPDHEAEINAAIAAEQRRNELEADACINKWMNGGTMENAGQSSPNIERIEQPNRKHTRGQRRR